MVEDNSIHGETVFLKSKLIERLFPFSIQGDSLKELK